MANGLILPMLVHRVLVTQILFLYSLTAVSICHKIQLVITNIINNQQSKLFEEVYPV